MFNLKTLCLIGALFFSPLLVASATNLDNKVVVLVIEKSTNDLREIGFMEVGTAYLCPSECTCIDAYYDDVKDKSLEQIQIDMRTFHPTPLVPKTDG